MRKVSGLDCILLVDDDTITNMIHKRIIESCNLDVEVRICSNGREAVDYLNQEEVEGFLRPDLILLDINMPELNGWEFLERYAKLPDKKKAAAVVVMLTTSIQPADKKKAKSNGYVAEYVNKTLTSDRFQELVEHHFNA